MAKVSLSDIQSVISPARARDEVKLAGALKGYTDFKKRLKEFDPELRRAMDREIRGTLKPIASAAQAMVPERPLSGWRIGSDRGKGPSQFPDWDAANVRKGIKVRQGGRRKIGNATQSTWRIRNLDAGGAVFELAGRRSTGNGISGPFMISALSLYHGRPMRLIWAAWDQAGGAKTITRDVTEIIRAYESKLEMSMRAAKD